MEYFCDRYIAFQISMSLCAAFGFMGLLYREISIAVNDISPSAKFMCNVLIVVGAISALILIFMPSKTYMC